MKCDRIDIGFIELWCGYNEISFGIMSRISQTSLIREFKYIGFLILTLTLTFIGMAHDSTGWELCEKLFLTTKINSKSFAANVKFDIIIY